MASSSTCTNGITGQNGRCHLTGTAAPGTGGSNAVCNCSGAGCSLPACPAYQPPGSCPVELVPQTTCSNVTGGCTQRLHDPITRTNTGITIFGGTPDADLAASRKRRHRAAGYVFVVLFLAVSYLCVAFAMAARTEPSPRAALHILLALAIVVLLTVKVLFLRLFRHFYEQAKIIGTMIGVLSFVLVGISAGYFLALSRLGQDRAMDRSAGYALRGPFLAVTQVGRPGGGAVRTDRRSIERGGALRIPLCRLP